MPSITRDGQSLYYLEAGDGEQTVILSHSYVCDSRQYEHQIAALAGAGFHAVAYDHRDSGSSGLASGPYTLEDMVDDGLAVIDQLGGGRPVDWVGLSTGGFVGMRIAARYPEKIRRLVLMDTSAGGEPRLKRLRYDALLLGLRLLGVRAVIGPASKSLFGKTFLKDRGRTAERDEWIERMCGYDPGGLVRFGKAIFSRPDFEPQLGAITAPTMVIIGAEDTAIGMGPSLRLQGGIPGARLEVVEKAGHLATIEAPEACSRLILEHLQGE